MLRGSPFPPTFTGSPWRRMAIRPASARRSAIALLLVLAFVAVLSLAVYTFSSVMVTNVAATQAQHDMALQQLLADSAIAEAMSEFSRQGNEESGKIGLGQQRLEIAPGLVGHYAILKQRPNKHGLNGKRSALLTGLRNESAKLNLNAFLGLKTSRKEVIFRLMQSPRLSNAIAEGIADLLGIQDNNNQAAGRITSPPSRRLTDLDELLKVPGVTRELLYGEDQNCNGLLDANEDDGMETLPMDNRDGQLDGGWSDDWTLCAGESNYRYDRQPKINLNQEDLAKLYDQLLPLFGLEAARFVIAWRTGAVTYTDSPPQSATAIAEEEAMKVKQTFAERVQMQLGGGPDQTLRNQQGTETSRAGIVLGQIPGRKMQSLLDLTGCQVQLLIDGKDMVLVAPLAGDPSSLATWLPKWERETTLIEGPVWEGRININEASLTTMRTIPSMNDSLANSIIRMREQLRSQGENQRRELDSPAWLVSRGLLATWELRKMAPLITTGGSVQSGIAVGQMESSRTASAIHFSIDGRIPPARLRYHVDLEPLPYALRLP